MKDNYILGQMIGKGNYGDVYKCKEKNTNKTYVMKKINID